MRPRRWRQRPLSSEQPQGSDIDRQGHLVRWHNWQFYVALHPREGLVLYDVRFADRGTLRPIAYRMALSEIYVYYGLGEANWAWRGALDVGEYNAGTLAQALKVNEDVPRTLSCSTRSSSAISGPMARMKPHAPPFRPLWPCMSVMAAFSGRAQIPATMIATPATGASWWSPGIARSATTSTVSTGSSS